MRHVTNLVEMELVGLDGNAFSLMGAFKREAVRQGVSKDECDAVIKDCMSGDYNHLLTVLLENTVEPEHEDEEDYYDFEDED